jgi:hypothetical protein
LAAAHGVPWLDHGPRSAIPRGLHVDYRVTPDEKAAIAAKADAHSLSASSYLRRLGLAMPLQSTIDRRAILDLVKINADLGRFGGLIKMWLTTNADFESLSAQGLQRKLENTLTDVRQLQKKMSDRLEDL